MKNGLITGCADNATGGDAENAKLTVILIVFTRVSSTRVEEQLTVYPLYGLMVGMTEDDHICMGKVLGEMLIITLETIAVTKGCPFIKQVMPHCAMPMR